MGKKQAQATLVGEAKGDSPIDSQEEGRGPRELLQRRIAFVPFLQYHGHPDTGFHQRGKFNFFDSTCFAL
ncbi:hypothetical protein BT93_C0154 [Corymbia citriodora subsp. variegata]|nr:hypothetical protein BT93_C0154 [Corymbia citriodora subsp. variegata]